MIIKCPFCHKKVIWENHLSLYLDLNDSRIPKCQVLKAQLEGWAKA